VTEKNPLEKCAYYMAHADQLVGIADELMSHIVNGQSGQVPPQPLPPSIAEEELLDTANAAYAGATAYATMADAFASMSSMSALHQQLSSQPSGLVRPT